MNLLLIQAKNNAKEKDNIKVEATKSMSVIEAAKKSHELNIILKNNTIFNDFEEEFYINFMGEKKEVLCKVLILSTKNKLSTFYIQNQQPLQEGTSADDIRTSEIFIVTINKILRNILFDKLIKEFNLHEIKDTFLPKNLDELVDFFVKAIIGYNSIKIQKKPELKFIFNARTPVTENKTEMFKGAQTLINFEHLKTLVAAKKIHGRVGKALARWSKNTHEHMMVLFFGVDYKNNLMKSENEFTYSYTMDFLQIPEKQMNNMVLGTPMEISDEVYVMLYLYDFLYETVSKILSDICIDGKMNNTKKEELKNKLKINVLNYIQGIIESLIVASLTTKIKVPL